MNLLAQVAQPIKVNLEFVTITPFEMGQLDAETNEVFCPEMYYVRAYDKYEYAVGFLDECPDCEAAEAMASEYEQMQYEESRAIEPALPIIVTDAAIEKWQRLIEF